MSEVGSKGRENGRGSKLRCGIAIAPLPVANAHQCLREVTVIGSVRAAEAAGPGRAGGGSERAAGASGIFAVRQLARYLLFCGG